MKQESADKLVKISSVIAEIYGEDLHKKRQQSLAYAAMGVLASESLFLHQIAEGLVDTRGVNKKHATKQVDRLLSNKGISVWDLSEPWVKCGFHSKSITDFTLKRSPIFLEFDH